MKQSALRPQFVEYIPERLIEGTLYISERYRTAVHLCCCGCGEEVVTPLTPADWQLRKEGNSVTLYPSIGNWSFACQSHYWIRKNRVEWARAMTEQQIARVRRKDRMDKARYIDEINAMKRGAFTNQERALPEVPRQLEERSLHKLWRGLRRWLGI
jgi:hypothetical protein